MVSTIKNRHGQALDTDCTVSGYNSENRASHELRDTLFSTVYTELYLNR